MDDSFSLETISNVMEMEKVWDFVRNRMSAHGCEEKIISQFLVVVEELFVNVAQYAYHGEEGPVRIELSFAGQPERAVLTLTDSGIPFNPFVKEDPDITLSAEKRSIGGLGIYLSKKLSDKQTYCRKDGKNIVSVEKLL